MRRSLVIVYFASLPAGTASLLVAHFCGETLWAGFAAGALWGVSFFFAMLAGGESVREGGGT